MELSVKKRTLSMVIVLVFTVFSMVGCGGDIELEFTDTGSDGALTNQAVCMAEIEAAFAALFGAGGPPPDTERMIRSRIQQRLARQEGDRPPEGEDEGFPPGLDPAVFTNCGGTLQIRGDIEEKGGVCDAENVKISDEMSLIDGSTLAIDESVGTVGAGSKKSVSFDIPVANMLLLEDSSEEEENNDDILSGDPANCDTTGTGAPTG